MRRLLMVPAVLMIVMAVVPAATAGGCRPDSKEISDARTTEVAIEDCVFSPTVTRVAPGDTVVFVNHDHSPHTVTGANLSFGQTDLNGEVLHEGEKLSVTFNEEGVYPYLCAYHPSMSGTIIVGDGGAAVAAGSTSTEVGGRAPVAAREPRAEMPWVAVTLAALALGLAAGMLLMRRRVQRSPAL